MDLLGGWSPLFLVALAVAAWAAFFFPRLHRETLTEALEEAGAVVEDVRAFLIFDLSLAAHARVRWEGRSFDLRVWIEQRGGTRTHSHHAPMTLGVSTPTSSGLPLSLRLRREDVGLLRFWAYSGPSRLGLGPLLPRLHWASGGMKAFGKPVREILAALAKLSREQAEDLATRLVWARVESGKLTVCALTPNGQWPDAAELTRLFRLCSSLAQVL